METNSSVPTVVPAGVPIVRLVVMHWRELSSLYYIFIQREMNHNVSGESKLDTKLHIEAMLLIRKNIDPAPR